MPINLNPVLAQIADPTQGRFAQTGANLGNMFLQQRQMEQQQEAAKADRQIEESKLRMNLLKNAQQMRTEQLEQYRLEAELIGQSANRLLQFVDEQGNVTDPASFEQAQKQEKQRLKQAGVRNITDDPIGPQQIRSLRNLAIPAETIFKEEMENRRKNFDIGNIIPFGGGQEGETISARIDPQTGVAVSGGRRFKPGEYRLIGKGQEQGEPGEFGKTAKRNANNTINATKQLLVGASRINELLSQEGAETIGAAGLLNRLANTVGEQGRALAETTTDISLDPESFKFKEDLAGLSSRVKSRLIGVSYLIARSEEEGRLSDQDIQRALDSIGANSGSPTQLKAALQERVQSAVERANIVGRSMLERPDFNVVDEAQEQGLDVSIVRPESGEINLENMSEEELLELNPRDLSPEQLQTYIQRLGE